MNLKKDSELKKLDIEIKREKVKEEKIKNIKSTLEVFSKYDLPKEIQDNILKQLNEDSLILENLVEDQKIKKLD